MKIINIGHGNFVNTDRIVAITKQDSAPSRRALKQAREQGLLVDATQGIKTASIITMNSDHIVASSLSTEEISEEMK